MAFVLKKTASYKWEVKVEIPVDGNRFETQTFEAVFKKMSRSAFNDLIDKGDDALVDGPHVCAVSGRRVAARGTGGDAATALRGG